MVEGIKLIEISIFQSIKTNAKLSDDGKHWILNGGKLWYVTKIIFSLFLLIFTCFEKLSRGLTKVIYFVECRDLMLKDFLEVPCFFTCIQSQGLVRIWVPRKSIFL